MFCLVQKDPQIGSAITFEVRLVCLFSTSTNDLLNIGTSKTSLKSIQETTQMGRLGNFIFSAANEQSMGGNQHALFLQVSLA